MNLTPGIDMSTGSLGQGMSTALGAAWGNRYQYRDNYTYPVLGDGECEEGRFGKERFGRTSRSWEI